MMMMMKRNTVQKKSKVIFKTSSDSIFMAKWTLIQKVIRRSSLMNRKLKNLFKAESINFNFITSN